VVAADRPTVDQSVSVTGHGAVTTMALSTATAAPRAAPADAGLVATTQARNVAAWSWLKSA
jgi:hypothetical protein